MVLQIAWRGLWRNRRRTLLSSGAIAFTVFLLTFMLALQIGTYDQMVDFSTRLMHGHIQLQHRAFMEDPQIEHFIDGSSALADRLRARPDIEVVGRRAVGFMVASTDSASEVAQVMAVEPQQERLLSSLPEMISAGRYLEPTDSAAAVLGGRLAHNLGVGVGDEVVLLGTTPDGGMAAMAVQVVGLLSIAQRELDRILMLVPLPYFQQQLALEDGAHQIVLRIGDLGMAERLAEAINLGELAGTSTVAYSWAQLIPDIVAAMDMKLRSQYVTAVVLAIMVTVSIANTFLMMIFERTREFGMMKAIGMRTGSIIALLQTEALLLCLLGVAAGMLLATAVVLPLSSNGVVISSAQSEMMAQMAAPDRLYPALGAVALGLPPVLMLVTTQVAALIPGLRLRRLEPATAMRDR